MLRSWSWSVLGDTDLSSDQPGRVQVTCFSWESRLEHKHVFNDDVEATIRDVSFANGDWQPEGCGAATARPGCPAQVGWVEGDDAEATLLAPVTA